VPAAAFGPFFSAAFGPFFSAAFGPFFSAACGPFFSPRPFMDDGVDAIQSYIDHRMQRVDQVRGGGY
jgi:hypothetical protein